MVAGVVEIAQAYKLFSEGKTPIQVAIALNLREPEARQFYLEYWNLQHLYSLYRIYQEIKFNIEYFVKSAVAAGFNVQHFNFNSSRSIQDVA